MSCKNGGSSIGYNPMSPTIPISQSVISLGMSPTFLYSPSIAQTTSLLFPPYDITGILEPDIHVPHVTYLSVVDDSCNTENIKETLVSSFYDKLVNKWIYDKDSGEKLLKYMKYENGNVRLLKSGESKDDIEKNSPDVKLSKAKYFENKIASKSDIYKIMKKIVEETGMSWCKVPKNKFIIKEAILKSFKHKLKHVIDNKQD